MESENLESQLAVRTAPLDLVSLPAGDGVTREQAVALVAEQLAEGRPVSEIEEAVLRTVALRPHSEALIALCGAVTSGAPTTGGADTASTLVALICARTPSLTERRAALKHRLRHELIRAGFTLPSLPLVKAYGAGVCAVTLAAVWFAATAQASYSYTPTGMEALFNVFREFLGRFHGSLFPIALTVSMTGVAFSRWKPIQFLRQWFAFLTGVPFESSMTRLDAESALMAFAEAGIPAGLLPTSLSTALPPTRLFVLTRASAESPEAARALADLEYTRALIEAERLAAIRRFVVDALHGGVIAVVVLFMLGALIPM